MFRDHSICLAYLGFHIRIYFEHRVFLALVNVFSNYKNDAGSQNKVINGRNIVFLFTRLGAFE